MKLLIGIFSLCLGIYNVYTFYKIDKQKENSFLYQEKKDKMSA